MTRGDTRESHIVHVIQERSVVGTLRLPRIYQMATGDQLEVVWSGEDRALLPEMPSAEARNSDPRWQSRHWVEKAA
jgi:hypothetical protein